MDATVHISGSFTAEATFPSQVATLNTTNFRPG